MRIGLLKLLDQRPIIHPTRIVSVALASQELRIVVYGYPWWRDASDRRDEQSIELLFEGVTGGALFVAELGGDANRWAEALEEFEIRSLTGLDWAQPSTSAIYCSGPLKRPFDLYTRLHDFLLQAGSYLEPRDFLNYPSGRLSEFTAITASTSFLIARGPERIRQIVCDELDKQAVPHNVLPIPLSSNNSLPLSDDRLVVRLGVSHFLCTAAFAEFAELAG